MHRSLFAYGICLLLLWAGVDARADDDAVYRPDIGDMSRGGRGSAFNLTLGVIKINEDTYLNLEIATDFNLGPLRFGIFIPLRFRVKDEPPDNGVFRTEDWDEAAEWLRIVRYIEYGNRPRMGRHDEGYYLRAGELIGARLGHATIVNRYNNVVSLNSFQYGVEGSAFFWWGGVELLIDNVVNPSIMGTRLHMLPWMFSERRRAPQNDRFEQERRHNDSGGAPIARPISKLAFGLTLAADFRAPRRVERTENGGYVTDDRGLLVIAESEAIGFVGFDAEYEAISNDRIWVTPYTDFNIHVGYGLGWHAGGLTGIAAAEWLRIGARLEAMVLGANYIPHYVDWVYEIERVRYASIDEGVPALPKLEVLNLRRIDPAVGGYGELSFDFFETFRFTTAYIDYAGDDNAGFYLKVDLRNLGPFKFRVYWLNSGFDRIAQAFTPVNAMLVSEARFEFFGLLFIKGGYSLRWQIQPDSRLELTPDWNIGGGLLLRF